MNGLRESYKESIWPATSCIISLALRDYINFASEKDIEFYQLAMQVCRELPEFETLPLLIKLGCGLAALAAATLLHVLGRATVVLRLRPPPCLHHHAPEGGREGDREGTAGKVGERATGREVAAAAPSPDAPRVLPDLLPAPPDPPPAPRIDPGAAGSTLLPPKPGRRGGRGRGWRRGSEVGWRQWPEPGGEEGGGGEAGRPPGHGREREGRRGVREMKT